MAVGVGATGPNNQQQRHIHANWLLALRFRQKFYRDHMSFVNVLDRNHEKSTKEETTMVNQVRFLS
jgi:hypothetical protein